MLVLLLANAGHAIGSEEPVLQIIDYNVLPENIYPETTGQLELTIFNSGSAMATGTTIYYNYNIGETWNIYVGDIGADSQTITTVPFKVPDKTDSGIIIVSVDLYYRDDDGTSTKHSVSSIPITISQPQILKVDTLSMSKESIRKGDKLEVELQITNIGGVMKNLQISTSENSSFFLDGTSIQMVGEIPKNSSKNVSVALSSSSSADEGKYTIPLVVTYNDALQNDISQTVNIGPVLVSDSSSMFRISGEALSESEIGSELEYKITIENTGSSIQSATLTIDEGSVFTPLGTNTIYFDDLLPGEVRSETVALGIDAGSSSGYYLLPMVLKTNGDELEYNLGITVQATPSIILTSETDATENGLETTIRIANSGNTAIRSLYVRAEPAEGLEVVGADEKFIGTLNVDDFASFQVTLRSNGPQQSYSVPITVQFKDNDNKEHTMTQLIGLETGGSALSSLSSDTRPARANGPSFGPNPLLYLAGGLLLIGVVYFGYKKWKGR